MYSVGRVGITSRTLLNGHSVILITERLMRGKIWHLDKDIIEAGNRVYRAQSCLFVPNEINVFFFLLPRW